MLQCQMQMQNVKSVIVTVEDQTLPEGSKYEHDSASPSYNVKLLSQKSESTL